MIQRHTFCRFHFASTHRCCRWELHAGGLQDLPQDDLPPNDSEKSFGFIKDLICYERTNVVKTKVYIMDNYPSILMILPYEFFDAKTKQDHKTLTFLRNLKDLLKEVLNLFEDLQLREGLPEIREYQQRFDFDEDNMEDYELVPYEDLPDHSDGMDDEDDDDIEDYAYWDSPEDSKGYDDPLPLLGDGKGELEKLFIHFHFRYAEKFCIYQHNRISSFKKKNIGRNLDKMLLFCSEKMSKDDSHEIKNPEAILKDPQREHYFAPSSNFEKYSEYRQILISIKNLGVSRGLDTDLQV